MNVHKLTSCTLALAILVIVVGIAEACPTCKDQIANDPAAHNIARGYAYSIVFMISMPILILTGLGSYFYWEIRRAYAREALEQSQADKAQSGHDVYDEVALSR